ncbi:hypothetical protein [Micromonospora sp. NBC_01796]|uniref:hypothetical protein n=1 Tax=Micromonospora sp. NBC_01796 TaxID=2975987 RepID=UPI002DDBD0BC|nr:hypothetical protein [Micromonospora sp. NBC_01796]WSA83420.1 hypothetical protein OIE47_23805 [Micromonospora sp. NBC_01796]
MAFAGYENRMGPRVTVNRKRPPGGTSGFAPSTRRGMMMGGIQKGANAIALRAYGG